MPLFPLCVGLCVGLCCCCASVVIDRTAAFVVKTGSAGEEQLLAKNRNNRKFAFLAAQSPYHAYYKHVLSHSSTDSSSSQQTAAADQQQRRREEEEERERKRAEQKEEERQATRRKAEMEAEARKPRTLQQRLQLRMEATRLDEQSTTAAAADSFSAAPLRQFSIAHPSHYSSSELDVVHLTALYASHLGGGFLSSLQHRERTNAAFDFLKPQHPLYSYYVGVRQSVERVLRLQTRPLLAEYEQCIQRPSQLLGRLLVAARRRRQEQAEEEARQREAQEDTEVMAAIDWQSFVVVETVDFTADEAAYLPQPKQTIEEMEALIAELAIEEEREREERERLQAERRQQERMEQEALQLEAAAAAAAAASMPAPLSSTGAGAVIEPADEQLEVRASVLPVAAAAAAGGVFAAPSLASKLVTCVVCGDTIAAEDLEEHLRIELLDPRWKEQKQALIDRQRETSLVAGKSISDNLRRFEKKKREVGRERSREEEDRQEREDALLLRGAAREEGSGTVGQRPGSSAAAPLPPSTTASAVVPPTAPLPSAADEPLPKRARPTSPASVPGSASASAAPLPPSLPSTATSVEPSSAPRSSVVPAAAAAAASAAAALSTVPPLLASSPAVSAASSFVGSVSAALSAASRAAPLVDEAVWLSAHPMELTVLVRVPVDAASPFDLAGQELSVACRLTDTVDVLKAAVSAHCKALPANRQQFQLLTGGFLKEGHSLAHYNVYDGALLSLKLKERGGKRK